MKNQLFKISPDLKITTDILLLFGLNGLDDYHSFTKQNLIDMNIVEITPSEAYAANSLWLNGTVLVPAGHPRSAQAIEDRGYRVVPVDVSEFQKLDGGLSCLSLRF